METANAPEGATNYTVLGLKEKLRSQGSLIPIASNPFYIVTPAYTRISAGIKVLHSLCHYLNLLGEKAYLVIYPLETASDPAWPYFARFAKDNPMHPAMQTPLLDEETAKLHFEQGLTPICVYPEVYDDPISAPFIARYILNYPGLLAPKYKTPHQLTISYSQKLADYVGTSAVLHIPTVDLNFFYKKDGQRSGSCFYAGKFKSILKGDHSILPSDSTEILRSDKMSLEEVRDIFWSSEVFYCYEDTALAIEAALCGCAVSFVPNEHFKQGTIAQHELGNDGFVWGKDSGEIERAIKTVDRVPERVRDLYAAVPATIADFALKAKEAVRHVPYEKPVRLPNNGKVVFIDFDGSYDGLELPPVKIEPPKAPKRQSAMKKLVLNWVFPPGIASLIAHAIRTAKGSRAN